MKRTDFRFFDRLRVRWSEVDMQKIVFNGHYLIPGDGACAGLAPSATRQALSATR